MRRVIHLTRFWGAGVYSTYIQAESSPPLASQGSDFGWALHGDGEFSCTFCFPLNRSIVHIKANTKHMYSYKTRAGASYSTAFKEESNLFPIHTSLQQVTNCGHVPLVAPSSSGKCPRERFHTHLDTPWAIKMCPAPCPITRRGNAAAFSIAKVSSPSFTGNGIIFPQID